MCGTPPRSCGRRARASRRRSAGRSSASAALRHGAAVLGAAGPDPARRGRRRAGPRRGAAGRGRAGRDRRQRRPGRAARQSVRRRLRGRRPAQHDLHPAAVRRVLEYFPDAGGCARAAVLHHWGEVVEYRVAVGVLGLPVLGAAMLWRRRRRGRQPRYWASSPTGSPPRWRPAFMAWPRPSSPCRAWIRSWSRAVTGAASGSAARSWPRRWRSCSRPEDVRTISKALSDRSAPPNAAQRSEASSKGAGQRACGGRTGFEPVTLRISKPPGDRCATRRSCRSRSTVAAEVSAVLASS
jgi:hypothetical protein